MPETAIANLFHIQDRFLRSAHLERDFADASSLNGYVLTPPIRSNLERLTIGLTRNSGQRAWRITGDYGSGKSSFGLVLAHLFGGQIDQLPTNLRRIIDFKKLGAVRPQLLPVLVTGSREPMAGAFLRSLHTALLEAYSRGRMPKLFGEIEEQLKLAPSGSVPDAAVVEILVKANAYISESGKGTGLLVIIDELGKFLEYAALHPDRQDIYLLQKLAEVAARSGETPLFIVGLLHQGFNAYADSLSQSAQKEWEKVAGRFEEILFNQPMDQIANLVINALNIRAKQLPESIIKQAQQGMRAALDIGWYGVASHAELIESAARLYPLHPTVLPVLVKLLSRFGQNERSLFSFLLSNEPFGLQDFSAQLVAPNCFYRIHNLYDYARTTFGHRLSIQSYRSHWNQIDSMIESFSTDDVVDLQILKTVGLLNMLDANNLLASEQAIKSAIFGEGAIAQRTASTKVHDLQRGKRVLYYRGAAGGYCLWPHTSINLEKAYEDASQALGTSQRISSLIQNYLETRPVVARRHYIQTGNLRHFSVHYLPTAELDTALNVPTDGADGVIIIPLCETEEERLHALRFAESEGLKDRPEVLVAVPRPLGNLAGLVQEAQRWQWIAENTAELNADTFAAEEVTRQIAASRQMLEKRVHAFIGLKQFTGKTELLWFRLCQLLEISNGRELLSYLSNVCDEVYKRAPRILNELVNRNSLSSAASAARMRLIERMFKSSTEPLLGMDPTKKPPEMSIYLSVLRSAGLHQDVGDSHALIVPEAKADSCNVRPALQHIQRVLEKRPDKRIKISEVLAELRRPPFGIRDGVSAILLAAFAVINEQDVAFYENGSFMRHVEGFDFLRLTKNPEAFEIQYCKIAGVRSELFDRMLKILRLKSSNKRKLDLLDVVRPLCVFAAQLPAYTHKTKKLSEQSIAVRTELVSAREPATLLFHQLPQACGYSGFPVNGSIESSEVRDFVISLKDALDELKAAFPELQDRMKATVAKAFDVSGTFQEVREALSARAENILITVSEMQLKAFCLRLRDRNLPEAEWLESLGSMICSMPPSKWTDEEEELFGQELNQLASRFLRVESMSFKTRKSAHTSSAVRVAITQIDGSEIDQVIYTTEDEEKAVLKLESQLTSMFRQNKKIVLAATARAFWKALSQEEEKKHVQTSASHPEFVWGEG